MRKTSAILGFALALLATTASHGLTDEHHIKAPLNAHDGSGVGGFVQLVQLPHGGANITVVATGLQPGGTYTSFYYDSANCTEPADKLGTFIADQDGEGQVNGKIDDDLDEVGSVSVRLGTGYGELQACAQVH